MAACKKSASDASNEIKKAISLAFYDEFKKGNMDYCPNGINKTSAKMTMNWLDHMLYPGKYSKPWGRGCSLMQYSVILEKITQDHGSQRAKEAALSQMEYCKKYKKQSHLMILERFINI
ncbi:hypothetical protein F6R98_20720 [Candidatus Methylospira mobilis]|uniref:Uncharacterized protein n=1 Tax=Candidatus Methylospira mobilis TaxID=1808979 RepID=A0A5Q0BNK4_9GAMM|nr:hypothetical protein [Candidatus Methylospira mobilis]QFY44752.1 hypothetical protein F6R98_20720 [Candidatus Methylospira mobilis]